MTSNNNRFAALRIIDLATKGLEHINEDKAEELDLFFVEDGYDRARVYDELDYALFECQCTESVSDRALTLFDEYDALYD